MKRTLSVSEAKMKLNRLVDGVAARDDELVLTKNGQPVAAVVPIGLYEGLEETQAIKSDPDLLAEIQAGVARLRRRHRRYSFAEVFGEKLD